MQQNLATNHRLIRMHVPLPQSLHIPIHPISHVRVWPEFLHTRWSLTLYFRIIKKHLCTWVRFFGIFACFLILLQFRYSYLIFLWLKFCAQLAEVQISVLTYWYHKHHKKFNIPQSTTIEKFRWLLRRMLFKSENPMHQQKVPEWPKNNVLFPVYTPLFHYHRLCLPFQVRRQAVPCHLLLFLFFILHCIQSIPFGHFLFPDYQKDLELLRRFLVD